jgi:hypothetical protein
MSTKEELRRLVKSAVYWCDGEYDRRAHAREIIDSVIADIIKKHEIPRSGLELLLADREVLIAEELGNLVDVDDLLRTIDTLDDEEDDDDRP